MKPFQTRTVETKASVVDDKLLPDAEMQILVGGPYTLDGEEHRYGHTAIRVKTLISDKTYDFGRYGRVTGDFGAEGEGILRVWTDFQIYIKAENALGRKTTAFVYSIYRHQAQAIGDYYSAVIAVAKPRTELERGRAALKVYQLAANYHALGYNCTTFSLDGAHKVFSYFENGSRPFIKPEAVLTLPERLAMRALVGAPTRVFLPANLIEFLNDKSAVKPSRIESYGK